EIRPLPAAVVEAVQHEVDRLPGLVRDDEGVPRGDGTGDAVDVEVVQGIAVRRGPGGAVDADVPAGTGQARVIVAAGGCVCGGCGDRRPGGRVGRHLDLVVLAGRGLPVELYFGDVEGPAEIDIDPLRIGELAAPACGAVAIDRVPGRERAGL